MGSSVGDDVLILTNEHANRHQCVIHLIPSTHHHKCSWGKKKKISIDQLEFVFILKTFEFILKSKVPSSLIELGGE